MYVIILYDDCSNLYLKSNYAGIAVTVQLYYTSYRSLSPNHFRDKKGLFQKVIQGRGWCEKTKKMDYYQELYIGFKGNDNNLEYFARTLCFS